jgi:hypothetical protein
LITINWKEFKEYKQHAMKENNFDILLDFMKSYYNMTSPLDMYDTLNADSTAKLMLDKRNIDSAEDLETFLFQR